MSRLIAAHLIFGCYGFWLPNDPRGSWSTYVGSYKLYEMGGAATKVNSRESYASLQHDHRKRMAAKRIMKHQAMIFDSNMRSCVGRAFQGIFQSLNKYPFACAIMQDHVHLLVGEMEEDHGVYVRRLKAAATRELRNSGLVPEQKVWARNYWTVYVYGEQHFDQAKHYIEMNPVKEGMSKQYWDFVH